MVAQALAVTSRIFTGTRPFRVMRGERAARNPGDLKLYDERGRFIGTVAAPTQGSVFGTGAATVLLRRAPVKL